MADSALVIAVGSAAAVKATSNDDAEHRTGSQAALPTVLSAILAILLRSHDPHRQRAQRHAHHSQERPEPGEALRIRYLHRIGHLSRERNPVVATPKQRSAKITAITIVNWAENFKFAL